MSSSIPLSFFLTLIDHICCITLAELQEGTPNFVEIFNTNQEGLEVSPLGQLSIASARASHAGQYLCQVTNGVGQPLHVIVNVTVKSPPKIVRKSQKGYSNPSGFDKINVAIKDPHLKLECTAMGDRPITVKWTKVTSHFRSMIFTLYISVSGASFGVFRP